MLQISPYNYVINNVYTFSPIFSTLVNTLIYATQTLLVFTNYLLIPSTYNINNPETTHLLPLPLYNPITQEKVVT